MFRIVSTRRRLYTSLAAGVVVAAIGVGTVWVVSSFGESPAAPKDNRVVSENRLPGTDQWRLVREADDVNQQIKGYASATSVNVGQTITFFVTVNPAQAYAVDIYRFGYYQGKGGRLVEHRDGLQGTAQPPCAVDPETGMISCNWSPTFSLTVPSDWTSGVFLAKLTNAAGLENYIIFTVRDDVRRSHLLYQQSVSTYQAYNNYPNDSPAGSATPATGKSLYDYNSSATQTSLHTERAVKVSYDRPYADDGAGDFLKVESYFVRWVEQNGYDVTYSTDVDTDLNGGRLREHRGFLSVGHDEYWSKAMFDAAAAARDAGVGLGFFGGNAVFWQIRFEPSADGRPDRVQVCYKDVDLDPVKDATATVHWREVPVDRSEQQLMGGISVAQQPAGAPPAPYVVTNSANWVYAGTGLRDGDSVPGIVGYEVDRRMSGQPEPIAAPGTYVALSHSPITASADPTETEETTGTDYQESTLYQAPSGAWVFDAGSIRWSWGLYKDEQTSADPRLQRMAANLLDRFIAGPTPPPAAPSNFAATASASRVHLSWSKKTDADSYVLERSTAAAFDANVASFRLPGKATSYDDTRLAPSIYYYRIQAINANGRSPYSPGTRVASVAYMTLVEQSEGLIAHWRLGEESAVTAWDVTGAYNGSYVGGPTPKSPGAIVRDPDTSMGFNGMTSRVTLPSLPSSVNFTVAGWTYLTSTADTNNTLYGGNGSVRLLARPGVPNSASTAYAGVWLNGTEYVLQPDTPGSNVNVWVHWALTRDGNKLTLYRNGVEIGTRADLPKEVTANLAGTIGVQTEGAYGLTGRIDEVSVYGRALSPVDIGNEYIAAVNGIAPPPAPAPPKSYRDLVLGEDTLISYWRLGEKKETTAADSKGKNAGTYVNGVALGVPGAMARDRDGAAGFNGGNQYVDLPPLENVGDFTIEGWTKLTDAAGTNNAMYGADGKVRLLARPGRSTSPTAAYGGVWLNNVEYYLQPNSATPNVDRWVYWALTRQGGTLTLYRDGAQIGQRTDLPATAPANISGSIGAQGGSAYALAGSVDDVAVYRGALSPVRITQHYRAALFGPVPR